ncbi:MAG: site-2 protease family protein [Terriglobales bacterium]
MPGKPRNRRLARVAGIDIQFHSSWLIILALFGLTLAAYFRAYNPGWSELVVVLAAAVTTALLAVSVVLHELAHSLVARAHGLPVHAITLFVFGGVSELTREPDDAATEFRIAIAGPLTSLVLGAICVGLAQLGNVHQVLVAMLAWLGWINLALALFNLIPGFPLDGGRVLRAILWRANRDFVKSTRWATRAGRVCALACILYGVFEFFGGATLDGMWLAFIGWFLYSAADQSWRQTEAQAALGHFTVRDLESPFYSRVAPDLNLEAYVTELASQHSYRASLVMDADGQLLGILTPADAGRVPRADWGTTLVREIMVPRDRMATVAPADGLVAALRKMAEHNVGQLPVLAEGSVRGVIRRDRIIELLQSQLDPGRAS